MKHIKLFDAFINEKTVADPLHQLIDILVNSMEYYDEDTFMDLAKDFGYDPEMMKEVFNDYWNLDAKDRLQMEDKEWIKWLKGYGIK